MLLVDDLDLLDETSVAVLVPLVVSRTAFLIGTVRTDRVGRAPSPRLTGLQRDGHLVRLDLDPLGPDELGVLLHRVLDHPVSAAALDELARLSGGNLQVLTELVRSATERGALVRDRGAWRLVGDLPTTAALGELVDEHLAGVDETGLAVLELLAVCERFGLADLERRHGLATLEKLEAGRLVSLVVTGRRTAVRLAHPLYGEVLRARMAPLRLRRIQHELADVVEGHGSRRREDVVQLALWRIESGGRVAGDQLLQAARLALAGHDPAPGHAPDRRLARGRRPRSVRPLPRCSPRRTTFSASTTRSNESSPTHCSTSSPTRSAVRCRAAWRGPDSRRSETSPVRSRRWTKRAPSCATPTSSASSRVAARCCSPTPDGPPTRSRCSTRSSSNRTPRPTSSWRPPER